jgi:acetolactate synthase-1/2/3 large subunit
MMDSVPLVAITGQVARAGIGRDAFQETDVTGITVPITKHNYLVMDPADIPRAINEAFYIANTGRPGPVLVDIPKDVLQEEAEFVYPKQIDLPGYKPILKGHSGMVKRAARLIGEAKRPVIISGHGVLISRASKELQEFAERTQIPVITTLLGLSSFPSGHVLNIGMPGMHGMAYSSLAIDESDLVIAIGMRFDDRVTGRISTFAPHAEVIHIDIDPAEIGKNVSPTVPIVGDVRHVLAQLLEHVESATHPEWIKRIDQLKREHPSDRIRKTDQLIPQQIIKSIAELSRDDTIIVTGVGQHQMWAAQHSHFSQPNTFVTSGGLGSMGYEVPAAMGAQVARPEATVWSVAGDGGFQMTMSELATMVENHIPVKFALMNNGYLGMVRQWQEIFYENTVVATHYSRNPDFVKLAEAFGMLGIRVSEPSEIDSAVKQAMDHDGPVLVDFMIKQEENVYPMIPSGMGTAELIEESYEAVSPPNQDKQD